MCKNVTLTLYSQAGVLLDRKQLRGFRKPPTVKYIEMCYANFLLLFFIAEYYSTIKIRVFAKN